jgi:predicted GNAT family acetyltransferase
MSGAADGAVRHDPVTRRYELAVDGHVGFAAYEFDGDRQVFTHTFVPPELRGRGIAEKLVRAALMDAQAAGRKVVPACSFVAKFIERNREFQGLVGE